MTSIGILPKIITFVLKMFLNKNQNNFTNAWFVALNTGIQNKTKIILKEIS